MTTSDIISAIDSEVAKLQQARAILSTMPGVDIKRGLGRPSPSVTLPKKRTMSAEARARIAAAQKKRWAAKSAAK